MPDFSPEIIRKAADAIEPGGGRAAEAFASAALDAVAAELGEVVAQKILAHMEASGPPMRVKLKGDAAVRRLMRRQHFGTAARIASRAFLTEQDTLRQVAAALERGDYVACQAPEDGDERLV